MDREWMTLRRTTEEYERGVFEFVTFAENFAKNKNLQVVYCPCKSCWNKVKVKITELAGHLLVNGIDTSYRQWYWHGETVISRNPIDEEIDKNNQTNMDEEGDDEDDDQLDDMLHDAVENFTEKPKVLDDLLKDAESPLYPGCTKFTRLSAVLKLLTLKAKNGWSDKGFTELLQLLTEILPEGNELPNRNYDAKKLLCPMGIKYRKIHACPNDCILYREKYADLEECPKCQAKRYKQKVDRGNGPPAKVLWYLPIIPRFKRLFANAKDAQNLRWHADRKIIDEKMRHPSDASQWKTIDFTFPDFSKDVRNLRLGLCTDGMNPHGNMSTNHSTWPVLLNIYNLPPWLCMKRKYIMLTLLISGPRQPGNDIDVFLAPLIEDLKKMWDEGVKVFDAYKQEYFSLRAMIFCTINDFPAYGNLSGYSVKGHKACPICEDETSYTQLKHGRKTVYLGHRRFLNRLHPYRKLKKAFNGTQETRLPPVPLTGKQVAEKIKNIVSEFGKNNKPAEKRIWKKKSIFFMLPYWETLFVRHCIDVMHVEKNINDSFTGTLLNIPGKTKDSLNARLDMADMGIRKELAPKIGDRKTYLPPASHTLSKNEKKSFCECLHGVKVPSGYSSNFKSLVSMKDLKLVGLKSHDCHTLMQQLLPVAIRSILPKPLRYAITRLCFFFNAICSKVIDISKLDKLQEELVVTLCQLEMHFPPAFFDIMVHLSVHLVREIKLCGPVHFRWMYPFERYMKILKGYVRNRHRPEGSIIEGYTTEEVLEFCIAYLANMSSIGIPKSRHEGRIEGKGILGTQVQSISREDRIKAHLYILNNMDEVQPYLIEHSTLVKTNNRGKSEAWLQTEHNRSFASWFDKRVATEIQQNPDSVSETIRWLAPGPNVDVISYTGYDIGGYCFYTKSQDEKSTMQNSGVTVVAQAMHISSVKDKNPVYASMSYYGVIENIWEIDYVKFRMPVFKCKWVENNNGVQVDELGFTLVDLNKEGHKEEPFIMASQAKQVFYVSDPADSKWSVVLQGKRRNIFGEDEEDENADDIDMEEIPSFSSELPSVDIPENFETNIYIRDDHAEGIWVENLRANEK